MAVFKTSVDITGGNNFSMDLNNGDSSTKMAKDLNGKMNKIQFYLQEQLPEVCITSSLPTTLASGKIIMHENKMYFGSKSKVPIEVGSGGSGGSSSNYISMGRKAGTTEGQWSIALGHDVESSAYASFASGGDTVASAQYSHTEGYMTKATGSNSHAEGSRTLASFVNAHAEGNMTTASEDAAHAEGINTTASGKCTHTEGYNTMASSYASHAGGKNNKAMTNSTSYSDTTGDAFVIGNGTGSQSRSNAFRITYAGEVYGLSAFNSSGADYAEYFEWLDGNVDNEDRIGHFVTLEGNKIKIANPGDYILGIVSGQPCIIGNADEDWLGRWEHDEYGRFVKEYLEYTQTEVFTEGLTDQEISDLCTNPDIKKMNGKYYRITYKVVDYETPYWRYKENPEYDNTQQYIERNDRREWDTVGMVGVLSVRDDGTCKVNGYCKVSDGGIATESPNRIIGETWRVTERVAQNVIKIIYYTV